MPCLLDAARATSRSVGCRGAVGRVSVEVLVALQRMGLVSNFALDGNLWRTLLLDGVSDTKLQNIAFVFLSVRSKPHLQFLVNSKILIVGELATRGVACATRNAAA